MDRKKLYQKGWSDSEIRKAESVLHHQEQKDLFFSKLVFWTVLIVIIFANILISVIMIPFLLVFDKVIVYTLTIILAMAIGFLYNFLITNIQHLERNHHLFASIIIPIIALVNMLLMVSVSNKLILKFNTTNLHNPLNISLVFAGAFILPFILDKIRLRIKHNGKAVLVKKY